MILSHRLSLSSSCLLGLLLHEAQHGLPWPSILTLLRATVRSEMAYFKKKIKVQFSFKTIVTLWFLKTSSGSNASYSYVSPDDVTITINWTANKNDLQADRDHLPTPPPKTEHFVNLLTVLKVAGAR